MHWTILFHRNIPWDQIEAEQSRLVEEVRRAPDQGYLLVFEPQPTFTRGRSADTADLLWSDAELARRGITSVPVDRGGKWTCHGPGQIVIFPLFRLESAGFQRTEIRPFVTRLRDLTSSYLSELGIEARCRATPFGLYVDDKKLVSFGVAVHEGIARHGLALYYESQSAAFAGIRSCGVANEKFTSLSELGKATSWEQAAKALAWRLRDLASGPV